MSCSNGFRRVGTGRLVLTPLEKLMQACAVDHILGTVSILRSDESPERR
jgi:hypothetical protein